LPFPEVGSPKEVTGSAAGTIYTAPAGMHAWLLNWNTAGVLALEDPAGNTVANPGTNGFGQKVLIPTGWKLVLTTAGATTALLLEVIDEGVSLS
jgi:hypothetical protein